jgi:hypothetical protein
MGGGGGGGGEEEEEEDIPIVPNPNGGHTSLFCYMVGLPLKRPVTSHS